MHGLHSQTCRRYYTINKNSSHATCRAYSFSHYIPPFFRDYLWGIKLSYIGGVGSHAECCGKNSTTQIEYDTIQTEGKSMIMICHHFFFLLLWYAIHNNFNIGIAFKYTQQNTVTASINILTLLEPDLLSSVREASSILQFKQQYILVAPLLAVLFV
jgi:hypothetical protein